MLSPKCDRREVDCIQCQLDVCGTEPVPLPPYSRHMSPSPHLGGGTSPHAPLLLRENHARRGQIGGCDRDPAGPPAPAAAGLGPERPAAGSEARRHEATLISSSRGRWRMSSGRVVKALKEAWAGHGHGSVRREVS
jgi:hypothetical protein